MVESVPPVISGGLDTLMIFVGQATMQVSSWSISIPRAWSRNIRTWLFTWRYSWWISRTGERAGLLGDSYKGEVEIDSKGFARIRFNAVGSIKEKIIKIEIDETLKEIPLGKGPYEIFVTENVCTKK